MIRTQIQLTEAQAQALKALAAARQCSVAELIRQGVDHRVKQSGSVDLAERRRRAGLLPGAFVPGGPTLRPGPMSTWRRHIKGERTGIRMYSVT